jgi:hypothetical protein
VKLAETAASAVCFRYVGGMPVEDHLNRLNSEIFSRFVKRGNIHLSNATLQSRFCLRAPVVNHRATDSDVDVL